MVDQIILGAVQGVAEWLPVSSEAVLVLIQSRLMASRSLTEMLTESLFLHGGTLLAALVYFRKDILALVKAAFRYKRADLETKRLLNFLLITSIISGLMGFLVLTFFNQVEGELIVTGKSITLLIGIFLLITGGLQIRAKEAGKREVKDLTLLDGLLLGLAQGLAGLPGLSRSGVTVSLFLLREFKKTQALKMSFLMSLPVVFAGNLALNFDKLLTSSSSSLLGLAVSFLFGLLTIHLLLKLAQKINFGRFVFAFGILTLVSALVF